MPAVSSPAFAARRRGARLPERFRAGDLLLLSVATHRVSRLVSKDTVTSPLRAPFTRFRGPAGPSDLDEEVRGHGARRAIGELVSCPFCVGQWVGSAFVGGLDGPTGARADPPVHAWPPLPFAGHGARSPRDHAEPRGL
jgi:hypothetical protein